MPYTKKGAEKNSSPLSNEKCRTSCKVSKALQKIQLYLCIADPPASFLSFKNGDLLFYFYKITIE